MDSRKYYWIDNLKAFGIFLVVVGHSGVPGILGKLIYGFHMPLFFVISGYLFNQEKWFGKGFWCFLKNRWKSYIKLYFLWAGINLVLNFPIEMLENSYTIHEGLQSTVNHIRWILISYGGSKDYPNCTPLWFLPCLFIASLYLFWLLYLKWRKGTIIALLISILMLLQNYFVGMNQNIILPWHIDVALSASVFMLFGYLIKETSVLSKHISLALLTLFSLIGIVAVMLNGKIDMNMNELAVHPLFYLGASMLSFVLMFMFFNSRRLNIKYNVISKIGGGKNTITILGLNYLLNKLFVIIFGDIMPDQVKWIADTIFVMIICYLVICANEKIKQSKLLVK